MAKTNALLSKCCSCKFKLRFAVVFVFVLGNIYILYGAFFLTYFFAIHLRLVCVAVAKSSAALSLGLATF